MLFIFFHKKFIINEMVSKFIAFTESEGSLPWSEKTAYPEPVEFRLWHHSLIPNIICLTGVFCFLVFPTSILYVFIISPVYVLCPVCPILLNLQCMSV